MKLLINREEQYQTIEGFGASAAWWAQEVGGWDEVRDEVAKLLFDPIDGIGLNIYRYNLGADDGSLKEAFDWRAGISFEIASGIYDWSKDKNAVWMMKKAVELGVDTIVVFSNSPPARLTKSRCAAGNIRGDSNLDSQNYEAFCTYVLDVVRHFIEDEQLPIRYVSPVNEPVWLWHEGEKQEGCHYTVSETVALFKVFSERFKQSGLDIQLSGPESGEFMTAINFAEELFTQPIISERMSSFDGHSYFTMPNAKEMFAKMYYHLFPDKKIVMSEWCQMDAQGDLVGIESALILANTLFEDLTLLNAVSWQLWIAVSKYDFNDGLIYVDEKTKKITSIPKRYYGFGNYSKFIPVGAHRIGTSSTMDSSEKVQSLAFEKEGTCVIVITNHEETAHQMELSFVHNNPYQYMKCYVTSVDQELEASEHGIGDLLVLAPKSITTIVLN